MHLRHIRLQVRTAHRLSADKSQSQQNDRDMYPRTGLGWDPRSITAPMDCEWCGCKTHASVRGKRTLVWHSSNPKVNKYIHTYFYLSIYLSIKLASYLCLSVCLSIYPRSTSTCICRVWVCVILHVHMEITCITITTYHHMMMKNNYWNNAIIPSSKIFGKVAAIWFKGRGAVSFWTWAGKYDSHAMKLGISHGTKNNYINESIQYPSL